MRFQIIVILDYGIAIMEWDRSCFFGTADNYYSRTAIDESVWFANKLSSSCKKNEKNPRKKDIMSNALTKKKLRNRDRHERIFLEILVIIPAR